MSGDDSRTLSKAPQISLWSLFGFKRSRKRQVSCSYGGFTLIELLVVIAVIAILAGILFPIFATAKNSARKAVCASNLKQLAFAALMYADDNDSTYVLAAPDIDGPGGGLLRWHGARLKPGGEFNPTKGPLWKYLARSRAVKCCPLDKELKTLAPDPNAFESGGGGYGYNRDYVGGTYYRNPFPQSARIASRVSDIHRPARTIMFADTAMPMSYPQPHVIEYSFCEPPYCVFQRQVSKDFPNSPSIHFRHGGNANVAWCDGHISSEKMSFTTPRNIYGADNRSLNAGWFGPNDNSFFDTE